MTTPKAKPERFPVWMSASLREDIGAAAVKESYWKLKPVSSAEWVREAVRQRLERDK